MTIVNQVNDLGTKSLVNCQTKWTEKRNKKTSLVCDISLRINNVLCKEIWDFIIFFKHGHSTWDDFLNIFVLLHTFQY